MADLATILREHVFYPSIAAITPGKNQPERFKRVSGALDYEPLPYQLKAFVAKDDKCSNPVLVPEKIEERIALDTAWFYSSRSARAEMILAPLIGFGTAIAIGFTGDSWPSWLSGAAIYTSGLGIGFGGLLDGIMRFGKAEVHDEPSCIGQGLVTYAQVARSYLGEAFRPVKEALMAH